MVASSGGSQKPSSLGCSARVIKWFVFKAGVAARAIPIPSASSLHNPIWVFREINWCANWLPRGGGSLGGRFSVLV